MVREIVHETIVNGSIPITFPMITSSNYNEWALIMEYNLHPASLWVPVEDYMVKRKEDRKVVMAFMPSMPMEMHGM